jgi:type III secretory pathway component EscS
MEKHLFIIIIWSAGVIVVAWIVAIAKLCSAFTVLIHS